MSTLRPIGHIACALSILAINIVVRMRFARPGVAYLCWVADDGCVYLAPATHLRARAVQQHAPEQRINTYSKPAGQPFPLTARDITDELAEARVAHALRAVAESMEIA